MTRRESQITTMQPVVQQPVTAMARTTAAVSKTPFTDALTPRTHDQAIAWCDAVSRQSWVAQCYRGNPTLVGLAVSFGERFGMDPLASLQYIAVINGKPCMYGDMMLAIASSLPYFEDYKEEYTESPVGCTVTVLRRGRSPVVQTFSEHDAKLAKLWGKQGPWTNYPARMCMWRARGFALRTAFPDHLAGIISREEAEDYPVRDGRTGARTTKPRGPVVDAPEDQAPNDEYISAAADDDREPVSEHVAEGAAASEQPLTPNDLAMEIVTADSMRDLETRVWQAICRAGQAKNAMLTDTFKKKVREFRIAAAGSQGTAGLRRRLAAAAEEHTAPEEINPDTGEVCEEPGADG
jgi:hypothetical protein